ncbi:thioredoxin domain-containing protein [Xanthomonas campestris pv. raphani]|uniref:DsbA family protein n=1 Tax=Xanthomonas campestris TaxID=339 RepID=UPI0023689473|nr:thioredoxin domain-containing protein [Xanthomonas campestris]MEA9822441.1 thioredoxin domain-containing protein [Xanthomonas campestris pv. raphani]MEA9850826.1 thioredoxin domain-containing protein [Xanthomonas campestris pv. raphani]MEA9854999.1 thioredoxin domain-containing protein [Xanthomonas campestris pv. raphani]MEA9963884.1 thioredoxin domain-containing protein [Xanthomonas campestris pv. raphani]
MQRFSGWRALLMRLEWPTILAILLVVAAIVLAVWPLHPRQGATPAATATEAPPLPPGPPWIHGRADARFTVTLYADLECPYCQGYFPQIKRWIDANPDVQLQWHHLPLAIHEPAASHEARLAECAGEVKGQAGFWSAVEWIYGHTQGEGQGLRAGEAYPGMTPALEACLDSLRPQRIMQRQTEEALRAGVSGTPSLQLRDHHTNRTMDLAGPINGDALLSALDLLVSSKKRTPAAFQNASR